MATRLVRFELEGGGVIDVEETIDDRGGLVGGEDAVKPATQTFQKALAHLKTITDAVMTQVESLVTRPEEVTLELGVSLKAEAGVVIAKTSGEGNLKLSLKWKPGALAKEAEKPAS